jgi:voltage-gated potassium channel
VESTGGVLFTILLLLVGLAIFAYVAGAIVESIAQGAVGGAWAERRRRRKIERMRDHFIICGYGRVGRRAGEGLDEAGHPFVVLDFGDEAIEVARERDVPFVVGSGTEDADLLEAGIERAHGVLASSDSDVDNLYITLSARSERPDLFIVARCAEEDVADKLRRAGANRVVQPYSTAGKEMATLVLQPQVAAFLDAASATGGQDLRFEEIELTGGSAADGKSIKDLQIRQRTGALIIALRKMDGTFDTTPNPEVVLEAGDLMITVGTQSELRALEELFAARPSVAG